MEDIAATLQVTASRSGVAVEETEPVNLNIQVLKVKLRSLESPFKVLEVLRLRRDGRSGGSYETKSAFSGLTQRHDFRFVMHKVSAA